MQIEAPVELPSNDLTPTQPPLMPQTKGIIRKKTTMLDLAIYHNNSLGVPPPSTLLKAIKKGYLCIFPGGTKQLIQKHLPLSIETAKGHLQSMAPPPKPDLLQEPAKKKVTATIIEQSTHCNGASFGDLTGRYPVPSSQGNQYILVVQCHPRGATQVSKER